MQLWHNDNSMISEPPQNLNHLNPVRFRFKAKLVIYPHIEIELYFEVLETRVAHFRILVGIVKVDTLFCETAPVFGQLLIVASAHK